MATKTTKTSTVKAKSAEKTTAPKVTRARKSDAPAAPTTDSVIARALPHDQIAVRAFERFVERGYQHGFDVEDWLAAERELSQR
jgi:hypothetical protein